MEKNTTKTRKKKEKTVWYRHAFSLREEDQKEFEALMLKHKFSNKTKFITSCVLHRKLKVVLIDQVSLEYHAKLITLINHFKALGINYNTLVNSYKVSPVSEESFKDIKENTLELSRLCQEIINLTLAFENNFSHKAKEYGG